MENDISHPLSFGKLNMFLNGGGNSSAFFFSKVQYDVGASGQVGLVGGG